MEIDRRALLKIAAAGATHASFSAAATSAFAQSDVSQPRTGGAAVFAISADPITSNQNTTTAAPDHEVGGLIYEGLTAINEDFSPEPCLAKSWSVSPDGLEYRFELVDAKWHDGVPMKASDVKYTIENISGPYSARFAPAFASMSEILAPDDRTVVIKLKKSFGPLLFSLSSYSGAAVMPEHVFSGTKVLENRALFEKAVGTGPFVLSEWAPGDRVVLKRNPNYWRPGRPYLDQITQKTIPDAAARVLALKAGEIDYVNYYYFPTSQIKDAMSDPNLQTREKAVPQDKILIFNTRKPPFDRKEVRQALLRATNRVFLHRIVFQGLGRMMRNHVDSRLPWAHDAGLDLDKLYPYDPKAAARILDEQGLTPKGGGIRFEVDLAFDSTEEDWNRLSQVLASMWAQVGVKVNLKGAPRNVMLDQVFRNWDFDATLQAYSTAGDPALGVSRLYVSSAIGKKPFLNASGYSRPEVDAAFDQGATASSLADRGEAYRRASRILAEDLPVLPVWETVSINVASVKLKGTWAYSTGNSHWDGVWLAP